MLAHNQPKQPMSENTTTTQPGLGAPASIPSRALFCQCSNWCRADLSPYKGRSKDGLPLITDHHPNCEHYNDSLIDVWKVEWEGDFYVTDKQPDEDDFEDGEIVTKQKMHREVYDQLPEFEGF